MKYFKPLLLSAAVALTLASTAQATSLVDNSLATWTHQNNSSIYDWSNYNSSQQTGMDTSGNNPHGVGNLTLPPPSSGNGGNNVLFAWDINDVGCNGLVNCHSSNSGAHTSVDVTAGQTYTLSYYEAAADRYDYGTVPTIPAVWAPGATIGWDVTLGGQSIATDITNGIQTPAPGLLTGWTLETVTFVAASTGIQLLTFIGDSNPAVLPEPIPILNCVNLVSGSTAQTSCGTQSVPEPNSLWLLFAGVMGFAALKRRVA